MKETGVLRRMDELGRIVIPKEIRKKLKIRTGDFLDIYVSDSNIILEKYSALKDIEIIVQIMLDSLSKTFNILLALTDTNKVIASTNKDLKINSELSSNYINTIISDDAININKNMALEITSDYVSHTHLLIKTISIYGDIYGTIIAVIDYDNGKDKHEILNLIDSFK